MTIDFTEISFVCHIFVYWLEDVNVGMGGFEGVDLLEVVPHSILSDWATLGVELPTVQPHGSSSKVAQFDLQSPKMMEL